MINKVILIGRLTKNIELKSTLTGKSTATFTLAVQRDKETADFIQCVAWERKAELLSQYTTKGSQIAIEGTIRTRSYDSNGRTVYVTEVLVNEINFLDSRKEETFAPVKETATEKPYADYLDITAEDLPF